MDTALAAAEAAVEAAFDAIEWGVQPTRHGQEMVDKALRPFVAKLAAVLRDQDWDCIEESQYFDRFPQEMLGANDQEYEVRLRGELADATEYGMSDWIRTATDKLVAHQRKMEKQA
jgi:hypothetical protein